MKMKRTAAIAAALALLFGAVPAAAADGGAAGAPEPVEVVLNGEPVAFPDAAPYAEDGEVFIPVRAVAERLGFAVEYIAADQTVRLSSPAGEITFRAVGTGAEVGGTAVSFEPPSVLKADRVFVPLGFFRNVLGLEAEYRAEANAAELRVPQPAPAGPEALVGEVLRLFLSGDYETLHYRWFTEELKAEVTPEVLKSGWEAAAPLAGPFVRVSGVRAEPLDDNLLNVTAVAEFENMRFNLSLVLNAEGLLAGIWLMPAPAEQEAEAPAGIVEEDVVVGAGTAYELGGTLTLPAVVLVHGSGPQDRDETALAYKPFRDLAWGLAQQGIAVLRYDKRTYVYGAASAPGGPAAITVKEETVEDAVAAANLLKADPRIDPSRVFIVGHSLGGMLAPRIDAEGGDFAGLVLLGGSPRALWDIIYDQNQAALAMMDDADPAKAQNLALVEAEYAKARRIAEMTDDEAMAETVFGLPAYYFKEMDSFDLNAYFAALDKPVLVLQGEDDFQVYADKDFAMYRDLLGAHPGASFKLYPGLNHFFVDYSGPGEGTMAEYNIPGQVDPAVISDIAAWILLQDASP